MKIYTDNEKEKILNALETIQNVCILQDDVCYNCPFGYDDRCAITANIPSDWTIRTQNKWKALE